MAATVGDIVDGALVWVGEVAGPSVEQYGNDQMMMAVVRAFNLIFKKYQWRQYRAWYRVQLDGILGVPTGTDLQNIRDFEDIYGVFRDGSNQRVQQLPMTQNPFASNLNSGATGTVQYWDSLPAVHSSFATKRIICYPPTSTEYINVSARVYPILANNQWIADDVMHFDQDMLEYGAAFMTLVGDDTNPTAAEAMRQMMEMRFRDITSGLADQPLTPSGSSIPLGDDWRAI